jgi:hypothetical protein
MNYVIAFVILATIFLIALILVFAKKSQYEIGTLKNKKSYCVIKFIQQNDNLSINICKAYFDMYLPKENIYCTIKQDNNTYNNYVIDETYKLHNINTSKNFSTCEFGDENYTDNIIYSVGIMFFVIFAVMSCYVCICAKRKTNTNKEENISLPYPISNESCNSTVISVDEILDGDIILRVDQRITNV